jgi:hypothetical protein
LAEEVPLHKVVVHREVVHKVEAVVADRRQAAADRPEAVRTEEVPVVRTEVVAHIALGAHHSAVVVVAHMVVD